MIRPLLALATILALQGCISFGASPPDSLLTLTPASRVETGRSDTVRPGDAVTILVPTVPQVIAGQRVPVTKADGTIAYVVDAQWVEAPNRLFQQLLSETIEARTRRPVLSPRQFDFDPGTRISGELTRFGIDEATGEAVVGYDATLASGRPGEGGTIRTRRFEARAPAGEVIPLNVGTALNAAANQVAAEVADWIGTAGAS